MPKKKPDSKNIYRAKRNPRGRFQDIVDVEKIKFLKTSVSFAKACPEGSLEWLYAKNCGYGPEDFPSKSQVRAWFRCDECNFEWQTQLKVRTLGSGCPNCNCDEMTDLREFPKALSQFDKAKNKGINPFKLSQKEEVWWRCNEAKDHVWRTKFRKKDAKLRCPFCRGVKGSSTNNLSMDKGLAKQFHPTKNGKLRMQDIPLGSARKVWWKCTKSPNHAWKASVAARYREGTGCPYCTNRLVASTNSLAVLYPDVANEWDLKKNKYVKPSEIIAASHRLCWWRCKSCEYSWRSAVELRTLRGYGCPACAGRAVTKKNCLATLFPAISKEWHPKKNGAVKPRDVFAGTNEKYWFLCKQCGHSWKTNISSRTRLGCGCPKCSKPWSRKKIE
ncbi:hypothetical protein KA183_19040 [bacterium]|nr:hypothetical protein [bacterium]